ncbi:MAG: hypothetical protein ACYDAI_10310 [Trichloromonadaceae bacterium]
MKHNKAGVVIHIRPCCVKTYQSTKGLGTSVYFSLPLAVTVTVAAAVNPYVHCRGIFCDTR